MDAFQHEFSFSIDGSPLHHFYHFSLKQNIGGHHHFEITIASIDLMKTMGQDSGWGVALDEQLDLCKKCIGKTFSAEFSTSLVDEVDGNSFKGIITNLSLARSHGHYMEMILSGYSPTILTSKGKDCMSFEEMSLDQIFKKVLGEYGDIETEINPTFKDVIPYVVQYKENDFHFLSRLAQRYGEWFFYNGEKLILGPPEKKNPEELFLGVNLRSFNWSLNLEPLQFKKIQYNYIDNEVFKDSSKGGSVNGLGEFGDFALAEADKLFTQEPLMPTEFLIPDQGTLEKLTDIERKMRANQLVSFTGHSRHPDLTIGGVIEGKGKVADETDENDEFYGQFIVIKVVHYLRADGTYENNFVAIPVDVEVPPINKMVRLVNCETQVAVVKKNVDDPDGLGRVRVNFQWQEANQLSPWLRIITPHAGENKGMYFIPEEEEEVIVGFENGDPERPFIIGSLYHGKNMPKDFKEGKNLIKAIRTKSNNEIQLYDEEGKESILIFNRDNQNEIILTLDEGGKIRIKTDNLLEMVAKDITMSASNNFDISVGNNMTIEVGKDLDMTTGKNKTEKIGDNEKVEIGKNREVTAGKKFVYSSGTSTEWSSGTKTDITAGTNLSFSAGGNGSFEATGTMKVKANGSSTYESMGPLTVKSTANTTVQGMMLKLQGQTMTDLQGSAMVTIKGGMVMIN